MRNHSSSEITMKTALYSSVLASLFAVASCTAPSVPSWKTMTLIQAKPVLVEIADEDGAREHGERMAFEARLSEPSGKAVGQLLGIHTIVDLPGEDGVGNQAIEERFTTMAVVFEDGDEILIEGANVYPVDQKIMQEGVPQVRAIIGGTGKYKGIRGEIKTVRNADETYSHTLDYRLD